MSLYHSTSYGFGQSTAGEFQMVFMPKGTPVGGVIFHSGGGGNALSSFGPAYYEQSAALTSAGLAVISCDNGNGLLWGNDANTNIMEAARIYLGTLGVPNNKISLIGGSMGGQAACNYARRFPARVHNMALIIPAVSVKDLYDRNVFGLAPTIDTAFGGAANYAAVWQTYNAVNFASTLNMPMTLWYSQDDDACRVAFAQQFIAAAPICHSYNMGNVGHNGDSSLVSGAAILGALWPAYA